MPKGKSEKRRVSKHNLWFVISSSARGHDLAILGINRTNNKIILDCDWSFPYLT